jgi:hypothetical protein
MGGRKHWHSFVHLCLPSRDETCVSATRRLVHQLRAPN